MTAKHQDTETQGAGVWQNPFTVNGAERFYFDNGTGVWQNPFTENPETDTQKDGKTDTPKGVTVWETFDSFMKDAAQRHYTPQFIAQIKQFFDLTKDLQTKLQAAADAAFYEETGEDSAPRCRVVNQPVLIDETPQNIAYLTGLFKPLVSAQYAKAAEIAQKDSAARGLRALANLNRQEMEVLNYVMLRARENLKIQADRLRRGLPALSQGGRFTYADVLRLYGYGKNADVNAKFAAAFDTLAREKFLFFDEVRGQLQALSILDFSIDLKKQVKTYEISPQFLNTLPAINACLLYYNIDVLTGGVLTAAAVLKYRGDKGILLVCVHLLFERPYYNGKPFKYSSVIERAAACGVIIKKSTNWKRAIKQAFNYLGFDVIDGDSDTARAMVTASGAEFTPDADKFIIRQIATQKDTENDTKK